MIATAVLTYQARREWRGIKWGCNVFIGLLLVLAFGGHMEAQVAPVRTRSVISDVHRVGDTRLCWTFDFVKARKAFPVRALATIYVDDRTQPFLAGVEHEDGTPFGALLGGAKGAMVIVQCVHLPNYGTSASRIAVRFETAYQTWTPWITPQPDVWINWPQPD